ncbi:MAG: PorP/SprF family type IX secretion system membrane protein [Flavobacteriales bacterium]|nr:PorP/SprF family type IX secretion system membrane protein [Flavobacteriales bacterium]
MSKIGLLVLCLVCSLFLKAQEIHLSQFYTNQQNLNPALMGDYDGIYRVTLNHRNQWKQIGNSPIITSMVSFDHKFYHYTDEITAGIIVINDQVSTFGYNTSKIQLSGSYKKMIAGYELRGGLQVGLVLKSFDLGSQTFPNQWVYERGEFDGNLDNLENGLQESQNFVDFNAGFAWAKTFSKFKAKFGFSLMHLNNPKDSYFDDKDATLGLTAIYHGSLLYRMNSTILIEPKFSYMRASKAQNTVLGVSLHNELENEFFSKLQLGLLYRSGFSRNRDAIIPVVGMTYKRFDIGLSYDFNVGKLSEFSTNKGTYELSLVFTAPSFSPKKMAIPCDRY